MKTFSCWNSCGTFRARKRSEFSIFQSLIWVLEFTYLTRQSRGGFNLSMAERRWLFWNNKFQLQNKLLNQFQWSRPGCSESSTSFLSFRVHVFANNFGKIIFKGITQIVCSSPLANEISECNTAHSRVLKYSNWKSNGRLNFSNERKIENDILLRMKISRCEWIWQE